MLGEIYKHFQLLYWHLSYRRKYSRTFRIIQIISVAIGSIIFLGNGIFINKAMELVLIALLMIELIYSYQKWKKDQDV